MLASGFIKSGGTAAQYLMADGSTSTGTTGVIVNSTAASLPFNLLFSNTASGSSTTSLSSTTGFNFVPASGVLSVPSVTSSFTGNVTGNATSATNTTITSSAANSTFYPTFVSSTAGNLAHLVNSTLSYNPSTNIFKSDNAQFNIVGNASTTPTIISGSTITPTNSVSFISGTGLINTITAPSIATGSCQITLIPTGVFTTGTSGNIALASTAVISKALIMTYSFNTLKWYPSY